MTHGEKAAAVIFFVVGMFMGGLGGLTLGHDLTVTELELEVETWKSRAIHQNEVAGRLEAKLSESEALLAKAVEALEEGMRCTSEHGGAAKFLRIARTTLAELSSVSCANLKGESDE
jgi:hypothetical protein